VSFFRSRLYRMSELGCTKASAGPGLAGVHLRQTQTTRIGRGAPDPHPRMGRGFRSEGPPRRSPGTHRPRHRGALGLPRETRRKWPRERSIEHKCLIPVFGTSTPPRGLSGAIRRHGYKYSEGRAAHWLILLAADRVDAWESHLLSFATLHPDNPITETGIVNEFNPARSLIPVRTEAR
jgi:hypothetical protein